MKQYSKIFSVIGLAVFIFGIMVLLNAANIGMDAANAAVLKAGGGMDGEKYNFIMTSTTNAYMISGAIVSAIGGLGAVALGYLAVKKGA